MNAVETSRRPAPPRARALAGGCAALALAAADGCTSRTGTEEAPTAARAPVATVSVVPVTLSLAVGQSQQLAVMLGDAAGNPLPDRPATATLITDASGDEPVSVVGDSRGRTGRVVTWTSSDPARVTVDAAGLLGAVRAGEATITATSEGQSGTARVIVTDQPDGRMTLTPARARLSVGETLQLTATGRDAETAADSGLSWSSDQPARAIVNTDGLVTATGTGDVTVSATDGRHSASAELSIRAAATVRGLDFPGTAGVHKTMRFEFRSPPAAYPATYIWRAYPRQQQSYYTSFFWGNNGAFHAEDTYYGFHPYPDWNTQHQHFWEIATPPGTDVTSASHVVYDRWYIQVAVCRTERDATIHEFYWDWPDTTKVLRHTGTRVSDPPEPGLVVGDAPWNPGNEVWDGVLRGFQFYDAALTPEEIARELAVPGSVRAPWYLNLDPIPEDIADKSGNGNDPAWVGGERPSRWIGTLTDGGIIRTAVAPR